MEERFLRPPGTSSRLCLAALEYERLASFQVIYDAAAYTYNRGRATTQHEAFLTLTEGLRMLV